MPAIAAQLASAPASPSKRLWTALGLLGFAGQLAWDLFSPLFPTASVFQPIALAVIMAFLFDCLMTLDW